MKSIIVSIVFSGLLIGGAIWFMVFDKSPETVNQVNNISIVGDKQMVEINAKGGYAPKISVAKANMPTILRVQTSGTFDCSSSLNIPSIGYRANLPPSGITEIEVPAQKSGAVLQGLCGMGMYNFKVQFN